MYFPVNANFMSFSINVHFWSLTLSKFGSLDAIALRVKFNSL